jgi:hypothetical protein
VKQLYQDIKERIKSQCPEIMHVAVFNNQVELLQNNYTKEGQYENTTQVFEIPAAFIEIESPSEIHQLGNGAQLYDPMVVKIHIVHTFFHGPDYDENLEVFDLKMLVFKALQKWEPNGCVAWVRTSEEQDYDHTSIYHFIMGFTTNYVDTSMIEPVNPGTTLPAPIALDLDAKLKIDNVDIRAGYGN